MNDRDDLDAQVDINFALLCGAYFNNATDLLRHLRHQSYSI